MADDTAPNKKREWQGFPSTRDDPTNPWPGQWSYGVDFAAGVGSFRVIAVQASGSEIKYGIRWIGPIDLSNEVDAARLEGWAALVLTDGGYVHLFPADGDASDELESWVVDYEETES